MMSFIACLAAGAVVGSIVTLLVTRRSRATRESGASDGFDRSMESPVPTRSPQKSDDLSRLIGKPVSTPSRQKAELAALEQDLRVKCLHSVELMERLIEAERDRDPSASRTEHVREAIERWERDNR